MDELFQKYKDVIIKNEQLIIENQKLLTANTLLTEELKLLKSNQPIASDQEQERIFKNHLIQIKKYTRGLLGYDMEIKEDTVELLSLYAFDKSDKIVFQINGKNMNLMGNEFIDEYKEVVDMYLVKGKSIPAFISTITLDLVNKKTFQ